MRGRSVARQAAYYMFERQSGRNVQISLTPLTGGDPDLFVSQAPPQATSTFVATWASAVSGLEVDHVDIAAGDAKLRTGQDANVFYMAVVANSSSTFALSAASAEPGHEFAYTLLPGMPFRLHLEWSEWARFRFTMVTQPGSSKGVIITAAAEYGDPDLCAARPTAIPLSPLAQPPSLLLLSLASPFPWAPSLHDPPCIPQPSLHFPFSCPSISPSAVPPFPLQPSLLYPSVVALHRLRCLPSSASLHASCRSTSPPPHAAGTSTWGSHQSSAGLTPPLTPGRRVTLAPTRCESALTSQVGVSRCVLHARRTAAQIAWRAPTTLSCARGRR